MAHSSARFRFYAELNDHLHPGDQYRTIEKQFFLPASVKDMIESMGVPHTEVDLVLVNGESSDFSRLIRDGDQVSVYPIFESVDITPVLRLRPQPLREPKFVLDVHLARLIRPFTRCAICNQPLREASIAEIRDCVPPGVLEWCTEFQECTGCRRVYWKGSHYRRMSEWFGQLTAAASMPGE